MGGRFCPEISGDTKRDGPTPQIPPNIPPPPPRKPTKTTPFCYTGHRDDDLYATKESGGACWLQVE
jgi:hypothetical protein